MDHAKICFSFIMLVLACRVNGQCKPQQLELSPPSSRQLTVTWICNDGGTLQESFFEYQVYYQLINIGQCQPVTQESAGDGFRRRFPDRLIGGTTVYQYSATLSGLRAYSSYTIEVVSRRASDQKTKASDPLSAMTDKEAPNVAPPNIRYTSPSQDVYEFNWDPIPCGERNGEVKNYKYMLVTQGNPEIVVSSGMSDSTSVTISDMRGCNNLTFRVAASTISDGPFGNVDINERSVPGATGPLSSSGVSATEFIVSWDPPDPGCPVTRYLVKIILVLQDQCMDIPDQVTTSRYHTQNTISPTGLIPYSTYTITVTPENDEGLGTPSTISIQTKQTAPTVKLNNLMVTSQGICTLGFSWNHLPCGSRGGAIIYVCEVKNSITGQTQTSTTMANVITIDALNCLTDYEFRVRAQNTGGEGPYTDYVHTSTNLAVQDVAIISDKTELYLTWVLPNDNCVCPITYDIEYALTNAGQCGNTPDGNRMTAGTTTNKDFTLRGLFPYSTYIVYITPVVEGRSGEEKSMEKMTLSSAPTVGPKVTVNEYLVTSSSIYFSWDKIPCESRGSPIESYNFRLTDENNMRVADDMSHPYDLSSRSVNITGLEADHIYTFTLSATTAIGRGPNRVVTARTSPVGPNPPESVSLVGASKTSLAFSWDPAKCGDLNTCNSIAGYSYTLVALPAGEPVEHTTPGTSATITDLNPCTMFEFRVAAKSDMEMTGPYGGAVLGTTAVDIPSSISNILRSDETTSTTLVITWNKPEGLCPVDSYYVQYRISERDMCQQIDEGTVEFGTVETTRVDISGLEPFSTYVVWITPTNNEGFGQRQSKSISTDEQKPSAAPVNVKSTSVWASNAIFVWDEVQCGNRHGDIQRYLSQIASTSDVSDFIEQDPSTQIATFDGLQPCTEYTFRVAAITEAGTGPMSNDISIMTKNIMPLSVTFPQGFDSVLPSTAIFQWNPSSTDSPGSCPADEYLVEYQLINNDQCQPLEDSPLEVYWTVSSTEIILSDLMLYSTYQIYVTARNYEGDADPSSTYLITATGKPTGVPLHVAVSDTQKRSLTFSWSLPICGERHGDIIMYFYELEAVNTMTTYGKTANTTMTSLEILDLTPFVNYTFRVAAATSAGQGPFSQHLVAQTQEDVPSAPIKVVISNADSTSITIQWSPPDPPHGVIVRYHIEYWPLKESIDVAASESSVGSSFTLSGLRSNDSYSFRVQAETSVGKGEWSENTIGTATEGIPSMPSALQATGIGRTSTILQWDEPENPNGVILNYLVKYRALQKSYVSNFKLSEIYTPMKVAPNKDGQTILVDDLQPSTKYEFKVSGQTSAGSGADAVIEIYTKVFGDLQQPDPPMVASSGLYAIIEFNVLPTYVSNVYVSVEVVEGSTRKRRQGITVSESFIVANLSRAEIEENMSFTMGDNKTYGGYVNQPLVAGETYGVRVAYASCIPEECAVEWSKLSVIKAPDCKTASCGKSSGAAIGGGLGGFVIILITIVVIVVIIFNRRTKPTPPNTTPAMDVYDEIDPKEAKLSAIRMNKAQTKNTGYEINLAMDGIESHRQIPGDDTDYEDVNNKAQSDYQGLNVDNMEKEHDYQGLDNKPI